MKIFSGIQPSGEFQLGNYLGAMKNWVKLQEEYECIFSIVDLHAITVDYDANSFPERIINATKDALAVGIDPEKSVLFRQSDICEHTELAWLLNTITTVGELNRMTQYKEKSGIQKVDDEFKLALGNTNWDNIKDTRETIDRLYRVYLEMREKTSNRVGLFDYPVLMAADILLYKAEGVPVGEDQVQHVELARDLAQRFNQKFGETFPIPQSLLTEAKRVMSLDGQGKMSKSKAPSTYIALNDTPESIRQKIASATTDDGKSEEVSPATKNLFGLLEIFAGREVADKFIQQRAEGTIKYSEFKPVLAEAIIKELAPIQERRAQISDEQVIEILRAGAAKIKPVATENLTEIKQKMGFNFIK